MEKHPKCNGNKGRLCEYECDFCFSKSFASSIRADNWSVNNEILPRKVFKSSPKKYEFFCYECGHYFDASLTNVSAGYWCPYCAIGGRKLCSSEDCNFCFNKSFASSFRAKDWSKRNTIEPRLILKGTRKKYEFLCDKCDHFFFSAPLHISENKFCPFCANLKLCTDSNCDICLNKSFETHPKKIFWSSSNNCTPREVFISSNKKFKFDCDCGHTFEATPNGISRNRWCLYCCKPSKNLCTDEKCIMCFNKSFASSPKAKNWSNKNSSKARDVFKGSNKKYIFECNFCSLDFTMRPNCILFGQWCSCRVNKTEYKLKEWLKRNFKNVDHQPTFLWCKNTKTNKKLPFDFSINKIIIELDGNQYFNQVSNWKSPEETQERDRYKEAMALKNGYSIIRLLQEDVYKDKKYSNGETWKEVLHRTIKRHSSEHCTISEIYNGIEKDIVYVCELVFTG